MSNIEKLLESRKKEYVGAMYTKMDFVYEDLEREKRRTKRIYRKNSGFKICKDCGGSGLELIGGVRPDVGVGRIVPCRKCNLLGMISWTDEIIEKRRDKVNVEYF